MSRKGKYSIKEKHKVYLSVILDLYDRRIVSYVVCDSNNNASVFDTFDKAIESNPNTEEILAKKGVD